jgi:hypothetical protein
LRRVRHVVSNWFSQPRWGVARITIASAPTLVTMSAIQKLAAELRTSGGFDMLNVPFRHPDAQALFQTKG